MQRHLLWLVLLLAACEPISLPGDYRLPSGAIYDGPVKENLFHGQGRLVWPDGAVYEGAFVHGVMQGDGRLESANGCVYEGRFAQGQPHGEGEMHCDDGVSYLGRFQQGRFVKGQIHYADGSHYEGEVKHWQPHGAGAWQFPGGGIYRGVFEQGEIAKGAFVSEANERYEGRFEDWRLTGEGRRILPDGEVHRATFENGWPSGPGERITEQDGKKVVESGFFKYGEFYADEDQLRRQREARARQVEQRLYSERNHLRSMLASLAPQRAGVRDLYVLLVGGDGKQAVFQREVRWVAEQLGQTRSIDDRVVTLANGEDSSYPLATRTSLKESLTALDAVLDPQEDLLYVHLVSHGSQDGELVLDQPGLSLMNFNSEDLAQWLDALSVENQWLVISACYSGAWINELASAQRLILTSAAADRTSFGCSDDSELTWFSRALYEQQGPLPLRRPRIWFENTRRRVAEMEKAQGISGDEHSLPQAHFGERFLAWWHGGGEAR